MNLDSDELHAVAEALAISTRVSVKYDPIPHFTRHPRRLNRGPSMQGGVAFIVLVPIPAVIGVYCLIAFIVIMARAPHDFTPAAQILLTLFLVLFVGCSLLGLAWLFFIEAFMYRMWLRSFDSDYCVEIENKGWWGRYVRLERWLGGVEHTVYTRIKGGVGLLKKLHVRTEKNNSHDGDEEHELHG
ncbi:hypothetical protein EKO04_008975 [Ascochyta lentis]|uniref:Uncharacterized protein n=1 Tax=Ascochyta lentis TaxID=205686 RepID=A0A8H7MFB3_9PLEO|nr:hypothetical protein EKO04_008975 [Ascochyta lentis]